MKKFATVVLILIAIIVAIPLGIGMVLPSQQTGQTVMKIDRPPEKVWEALIDFQSLPVTGERKLSIEVRSGAGEPPVWVENMDETRILVTTVESEDEVRIVRKLEDQGTPMTADWTIVLASDGGNTLLTMDATTHLPSGGWKMPMFRFLMTVTGGQESVNEEFLTALAEKLGTQARFR